MESKVDKKKQIARELRHASHRQTTRSATNNQERLRQLKLLRNNSLFTHVRPRKKEGLLKTHDHGEMTPVSARGAFGAWRQLQALFREQVFNRHFLVRGRICV
jgi:hypothetical protein